MSYPRGSEPRTPQEPLWRFSIANFIIWKPHKFENGKIKSTSFSENVLSQGFRTPEPQDQLLRFNIANFISWKTYKSEELEITSFLSQRMSYPRGSEPRSPRSPQEQLLTLNIVIACENNIIFLRECPIPEVPNQGTPRIGLSLRMSYPRGSEPRNPRVRRPTSGSVGYLRKAGFKRAEPPG
jgi:hypothetical protein